MKRAARNLPVLRKNRIQWQASRRLATLASSAAALPPNTLVQLRDYQEECIQSVLSYLEKGGKRAGVSLATGSGKTVSGFLFRFSTSF